MFEKKPIIAIICSQDIPENNDGSRTNEVNTHYPTAICMAGAIPLLIPIEFPLDDLDLIFQHADGLLLIGGEDVALERFNGEPHSSVSKPNPERDELEIQLVQKAVQLDFPLLGICRGEQVMNVAMGGTLISDIPAQTSSPLFHRAIKGEAAAHHSVRLIPDTQLQKLYETDALDVNSYHHQAVKSLAPCFIPSAFSEDGLLEAFEAPDRKFIVGIQWHPERMQTIPIQRKPFSAFIQSAQKGE